MAIPNALLRKLPRPLKRKIKIKRSLKTIQPVFREKYPDREKILITGWPKSGNTWLRFLIYHLFAVRNDGRDTPLSFEELNSIQSNYLANSVVNPPVEGYPFLYRTHLPAGKPYAEFDKIINIHRNPFDTLISAYHFYKDRDIPFKGHRFWLRKKLHDVDFYVLHNYPFWKEHQLGLMKNSTICVSYEQLHLDTVGELSCLVEALGWDFDMNTVEAAVRLSSFKSIKNMGRKTGQQYGMAIKQEFRGEFARKGKVGDFYKDLKPETIEFIMNDFPDFRNVYGVYIDKFIEKSKVTERMAVD